MQDRRAERALEHAPKNPVHSLMEAEGKMQAMMERMESMVNAFNKTASSGGGAATGSGDGPRLPKPDPKFEGCWHCGGKDHTRRTCQTIRQYLKDPGNTLPSFYNGAYERFMANRGRLCPPSLHKKMLSMFASFVD